MKPRSGFGIALALTLALGGMAAGPASAAKPPVQAVGQIYCQISGKIRFSPPLVAGGSTPAVARYKAKTGYCYSGADFIDWPVAGITGGLVTGSFTLQTNDCSGGGVTGGPNSFRVKWKAKGHRVVQSNVQLPWTLQFLHDSGPRNFYSDADGSGMSVSGSFAGNFEGSLHGSLYTLTGDIDTMCQPKQKGVPGGIKQLAFGGGDSHFSLRDGTPANT